MRKGYVLFVYLICSITFTTLLASSLDSHFDYLVKERILFGGWSAFTAARALSPSLVRIIHETGVSERLSALIYISVASFILLYAYAVFLAEFTETDKDLCFILSPFILLPMIWNYIILSAIHYIDDVPAVLFFVLGLSALAARKQFWFHLIFIIGIINRETAVFLIPAMLIIRLKDEKLWKLAIHSVLLLGIAYGLRYFLISLLFINPEYSTNGMFQNTLKDNFIFLKSIFSGNPDALRMLMIFGGLWCVLPFCWKSVNTRAAGLPITHRKSVNKRFVQLTWLLPLFFVGMLFVGNLDNEARIFNEMIPLVTTPCIALFFSGKKQMPER